MLMGVIWDMSVSLLGPGAVEVHSGYKQKTLSFETISTCCHVICMPQQLGLWLSCKWEAFLHCPISNTRPQPCRQGLQKDSNPGYVAFSPGCSLSFNTPSAWWMVCHGEALQNTVSIEEVNSEEFGVFPFWRPRLQESAFSLLHDPPPFP
jgi:hypothetical protein